jgi:hypothetical protein
MGVWVIVGSAAAGIASLLAGACVGVLSVALTLNYRGAMASIESAAIQFGERMPWIRGTDPNAPGRAARLRPVMLLPLYAISVLLVASAAIAFRR